MHKHSNALINESSPYLLQHAHNPVNWLPWGDEAFAKAKMEDKLVLVSIGYSSCHWCHVMEHESFEDEAVAAIMNEKYICIKVDREERPDIDQIYMNAVQLMTGQGGWPLNCFTLPDQRPVYGGTYFPKDDWKSLLQNLDNFFHNSRDEAMAYATKLTAGVQQSEQIRLLPNKPNFNLKQLSDIVNPWKQLFDFAEGGHARAPKFPLPNNLLFLMQYAHFQQDADVDNLIKLTLQKMAKGGIYDQLGGGFSRYSVDAQWHVPHFEKMLYDNAQLVSLYVKAFQKTGNPLYKQVIYETLDFIQREMTSAEGGFYSALDADSEGIEGKFYCWTKAEIELCNKQTTESSLKTDELEIFFHYFDISEKGNWEGTNVLRRLHSDEEVAHKFGISVQQLCDIIFKGKVILMQCRERRVRPGLDNKILAAWNGMMLKAYAEAYRVFGEDHFLIAAVKNAELIADKMMSGDNSLQRSYTVNGKHGLAFLDDYAFVASGFIALYQVVFDEKWLLSARKLTEYALEHFFDDESKMFFYTPDNGERLIGRKLEIMDNVIPSSNSEMANVLHTLGHYFDDEEKLKTSVQMLGNVLPHMASYGSAYSNWAILLSNQVQGLYEIAITGKNSSQLRQELEKHYLPNKLILGGQSGTLPLLEGKFTDGDKIYVCKNKTCQLPVNNIADALKQIKV